MRFKIKSNENITPLACDKTIYHLVLTPEGGETLEYEPGDWFVLKASNQPEWVEPLLQALSLSGSEIVTLRRPGEVTVREALTKYLEISQLNPAILNKLQRQHQIGEWADRKEMIDTAYGRDILDLLNLFPELKTWGLEFINLLSPLGPRYYSIASAPAGVGNEAHLVVKEVVYQHLAVSERLHFGVVSHSVSLLKAGGIVEGDIKRNPTFQLPDDPNTAIIMLGAGTGISPYISFLQQRIAEQSEGKNTLFFGETQQACSFLFKDFLHDCVAQNKLTLFTAFSRDQAEKFYVQDRIIENAESLWQQMQDGAHLYVCGSQYGLAEGVKQAWLNVIMQFDHVDLETAEQTWQGWRKQKRLQMDVY